LIDGEEGVGKRLVGCRESGYFALRVAALNYTASVYSFKQQSLTLELARMVVGVA